MDGTDSMSLVFGGKPSTGRARHGETRAGDRLARDAAAERLQFAEPISRPSPRSMRERMTPLPRQAHVRTLPSSKVRRRAFSPGDDLARLRPSSQDAAIDSAARSKMHMRPPESRGPTDCGRARHARHLRAAMKTWGLRRDADVGMTTANLPLFGNE